MNDELKPCPFCGKPGELFGMDFARCTDWECFIHYMKFPIKEWQTRPIESALRAQFAQAQGEIELLHGVIANKSMLQTAAEDEFAKVLAGQQGEIERLREALKLIAETTSAVTEVKRDTSGNLVGRAYWKDAETYAWCKEIARRALERAA